MPVNTSFPAVMTYTELENCLFCFSWRHPFKKEVIKKKLVPVFKLENVTKVVSQPGCCEGWTRSKMEAQEIECQPVCSEGCGQGKQGGHGTCSAPFTCTCDPGWTGAGCDTKETCPPGTWGHQCNDKCLCVNGAVCNQESQHQEIYVKVLTKHLYFQTDGSCTCGPGYQGARCEARCSQGRWGLGCGGQCACGPGHQCHPVTGDCVPCGEGTWGAGCGQQCACDQGGTALCSHVDGRCFCEGNYFGDQCQLHCPFGYNKKLGCLEEIKVRSCIIYPRKYHFGIVPKSRHSLDSHAMLY